MTIKQLSLNQRLLLAVSLVLTAFLGLSAFSLNNAFQASADSAQRKQIQNYMYSILIAAKFDDSGFVAMPNDIAEPKFAVPNSGLYAQITSSKDIIWQSKSMLGLSIPLPDYPGATNEHFSTIWLNDNISMLNLAYGIVWENEQGEQFHYTLNIAEDLDIIVQQKAEFQMSLWQWLGGTGLILLIAQAFILRWSLRPLHDVAIDLQAIKTGDRNRLPSDYPKELNQITENINTLLSHEESRRDRYKNSLADLAHSLKTPLAVFRGELENSADLTGLKKLGHEQIDRISDLVNYQLQRASTEGQSSFLAPVSLANIINKILSSLDKVYKAKNIHQQCEIEHDIYIHADEGDMYELLGNLLENAYKYCNSKVTVFMTLQLNLVEIHIDDDGNGIPPHAREDILKRGKRIDTQIEGQGLGLAIASDIITAYQGEIKLENSHLGGAKFIIQIPKY
ncbi:MAG: GHKL domain-containing protein [Piscirickettsiaceae bacterium]|nr:GHKL domain-containing protein [Piscirickettsiaceae bacterium]